MAMGFIKKMFSFGKKEVEEKNQSNNRLPDAVETALETQLPETVEAPKKSKQPSLKWSFPNRKCH